MYYCEYYKDTLKTKSPTCTIDNKLYHVIYFAFLLIWRLEILRRLREYLENSRLFREFLQKAWSPRPGCLLAGVRVQILALGMAQPSSHRHSGLLLQSVQQLLLLTCLLCPQWRGSRGRML